MAKPAAPDSSVTPALRTAACRSPPGLTGGRKVPLLSNRLGIFSSIYRKSELLLLPKHCQESSVPGLSSIDVTLHMRLVISGCLTHTSSCAWTRVGFETSHFRSLRGFPKWEQGEVP